MRIYAVTFDLWDTLIKEVPGGSDKVADLRIERVMDALASRGLVHTREELVAAYAHTGRFLELTWSKRRDMGIKDQVLFLLTCIDAKLPGRLSREGFEEIVEIYSDCILDSPPVLLPGAKEALEAVKLRGCRIGLICNTGRTPGTTLRKLLERMGILWYFDVTTFSNEILVRKPAEAAFRTTLDRLGALPKVAVHIGDNPDNDIDGAKRVGMMAFHVTAYAEGEAPKADARMETLEGLAEALDKF